jgi:glycosyltransferase involved in cell wall biosynthesis
MNSLVSCIVPAYNSERFISEALDSILNQTYRPLEIIVADDGSEDGTLEVVSRYGSTVSVVSQSTAGPSITRNLGLEAATGDFISFLDADDLWHPEKLAIQMTRFEERPELDICVTHARHFWDDELADERERLRDHPRGQAIAGFATTTLLTPRTVFQRVGKLDPDLWFADAVEWFLRAEEMDCVRELLPDVLVYHRMHRGNISRRRQERSRQEWLQLVKSRLDRRRQTGAMPADESIV